MKRVISILIVAALAFCLCACGEKEAKTVEEWNLSSYEWRRTPLEGMELSKLTLKLKDDKTFTLHQEVTLNGEAGGATYSGKYTVEGSNMNLSCEKVKTDNSEEKFSPAHEASALYDKDTLTITFNAQDSPYFLSATMHK